MTKYPVSYKVGCNFDLALIDGLADLNVKYHDKAWQITELYGSLPSVNPIGTARPTFRLKDADEKYLALYVKTAQDCGIGLNYTINVSAVDPRVLKEHETEIKTFLDYLFDIGVARVTVAHPLVGQMVNDLCSRMPIELSTILQIRHPRQLEQLKERCPSIQKICLDVFMNRDQDKLGAFKDVARHLGITLEMIVNEFCIYECPDRNPCYDLHALNLTKEDVKLFNHYPMGNCIRERMTQPIEWLWARFILPQWVHDYYDKFNIQSFKITGRTHPTSYIMRVTEAYMSGQYDGNLVELWADVENIGKLEQDYHQPRTILNTQKIPANFLAFYFNYLPVTYTREKAYLTKVFQECRE
jgi:collagenase-like PrtC family protease